MPEAIPDLDYQSFLAFWAEFYRPANCKIFLYGNIDTSRQLAFLDERFLSKTDSRWLTAAPNSSQPPLAKARSQASRSLLPCPPDANGEEALGGTSIVVNWLLPELENMADIFAAELLAEFLVGHDGAPLALALRESGLGEDISPQTGLDTNYRQPIFSIGLRGTTRGAEEAVEACILATLETFASRALDPEEVDTALHSMRFAGREIRRGSGTYGTRLMSRAFRTWFRGKSPDEGLAFGSHLDEVEARLKKEPDYFARLTKRFFLDNPHRSTITAFPDPEAWAQREAAESSAMEEHSRALSQGEREALIENTRDFDRRKAEPNSPKDLSRLPLIKVAEVPRRIDLVPRLRESLLKRPISLHPLFTNGIVYLDLAFNLEDLPESAYPWLPLLVRFITGAGLAGRSYDRMAADLARFAGGFGAMLETGSVMGPNGKRDSASTANYLIFRLKALTERFPQALDLVLSLLRGADTRDIRRVAEVLAEFGNDVVSALIPSASSFALARAGSPWARSSLIDDAWRGIGQYRFLQRLRSRKEAEATASALEALKAALLSRAKLRINLTASPDDLDSVKAILETALTVLPEAPKPLPPFEDSIDYPSLHEAYSIPTRVGFVAAACPSARIGSAEYAHESVLAHILSTGKLWEELRAKRGAYGASCHLEGLEGLAYFSTYRDPSPLDSLDFFGKALRDLALPASLDDASVEEAVVGAAGHDIRPLLPEERGLADFRRELYGINDDLRRQKREALLDTKPIDIQRAAEALAESYLGASSVLISRAEDVQLCRRRQTGLRVENLSNEGGENGRQEP